MSFGHATATLSLRMSGTLVCKGKGGEVLKEIPFSVDVTPKDLGLTQEQTQQILQSPAGKPDESV